MTRSVTPQVRRRAADLPARPVVRAAAAFVLLAIVTFVIARLSLAYLIRPGAGSPLWWPATGVAVVIMVRLPRRWWPWLVTAFAVGSAAASRFTDSWSTTLTYLLVNVLELALVSVMVARQGRGGTRWSPNVKQAWHLVTAAVIAIGGGCVVLALADVAVAETASASDIIGGFGVSHALGLLVVAPLLLPSQPAGVTHRWYHGEYAVLLFGTVALDFWIFIDADTSVRMFPVLVPVMWASIRFDALRAVVISFLICSAAGYSVAYGTGMLTEVIDPMRRQTMVQMLIVTVAGTVLVLVMVMRHRARLAAQAQESEQTLRIAIQDSLVGMYSVRLDPGHVGEIIEVNDALLAMFGYRAEELLGRHCRILGARDDPDANAVLSDMLAAFLDGRRDTHRDEDAFITAAGETLWVEFMMTAVRPTNGRPFVFVHVHDLTVREENKRLLEQMALHDPLTGLANRSLMFEQLTALLARPLPPARRVGVLYLDLDDFKAVNDTYGHAAGDEVLVEVAQRLRRVVRPTDTVARLGGDEFAIVCADCASTEALSAVVQRVRDALTAPFELVEGAVLRMRASIGAAVATESVTADELVREADAAMYLEKKMGYDDVAG